MSEKINTNQEFNGSNEKIHSHETKRHHERIKHNHEKTASASKHEHANNLEKIRKSIDNEAIDKSEHKKPAHDKERHESDQPVLVNKELKDIAYKRTLKKTQSKLSPTSRLFSKVIHQPVIEKASEVAGNTVARPSGILFGGIFSFLGSSGFLWAAKHYGYEYNFLLFIIFFAGGFLIGLAIELILWALKSRS